MSDYSKLKELAEAASEGAWVQDAFEVVSDGIEDRRVARCSWLTDAQYIAAANPAVVLGLIADLDGYKQGAKVEADAADEARAEVRRLKAELEEAKAQSSDVWGLAQSRADTIDQLKADNERLRADYAGLARFNPEWDRVAAAQDSVREHMAMVVQLKAEVAGLRTGYEAYEQVNAELKAEVEGLRKDSESYRLLSFCHGQGTLELVRSHHELCAEIRRLKILAGEPVPQTPEEFVGPSPEGLTARIRRKLAALGKGEQS